MALTLTEQYNLHNGLVKPEETSLKDLTALAAIRHHIWFENNKKTTDPETLARSYVDKLTAVLERFVNIDDEVAKTATYSLCAILVNTFNYSDLLEYTTSQWEELVTNNLITSLEVVAKITQAEKTAYNGL